MECLWYHRYSILRNQVRPFYIPMYVAIRRLCGYNGLCSLTVRASVLMTVHPLGFLLVVNFGRGRFLFRTPKVAASTVFPHSIRMMWSVRTVKRAFPAVTTALGFGFGSLGCHSTVSALTRRKARHNVHIHNTAAIFSRIT